MPKDYAPGAYYAGADPNSLQGQVMRKNMDDSSFQLRQSSVQRTLTSPKMGHMDNPENIEFLNEFGCLVRYLKLLMH